VIFLKFDIVPYCRELFESRCRINECRHVKNIQCYIRFDASEITYIVSGGALNSTHSLTHVKLKSTLFRCTDTNNVKIGPFFAGTDHLILHCIS